MKKNKLKKLSLTRETVHVLQSDLNVRDLAQVAGGGPVMPTSSSVVACCC
jgi:hypothetical protein